MGRAEEHGGKKHFLTDDYVLIKVLNKIIKKIGIEKFNDAKIWIETDNKLPDALKNFVILMTCVINVGINFIHNYF